jgi:hypothetical protein
MPFDPTNKSTPEEMAASGHAPKQQEWLIDPNRTPREILRFIKTQAKDSHQFQFGAHAMTVCIAEEQAKSAAKLERFTFWLLGLTGALFFIGIIQIILMFRGH